MEGFDYQLNPLTAGTMNYGTAYSPASQFSLGTNMFTGENNLGNVAPAVTGAAGGPGIMGQLASVQGLQLGTQVLGGLGNLYLGMKNYGLMKDQLKQSQSQFEKNFGAQRQTLNTQLEDRQRARVAANPGAHQSVGDYMDQNRIR